jgi:ubiquinone biosynthesis protein UbiJ
MCADCLPMSAPTVFLPLLEDLLNRLLRLDPQALRRLGELDGKIVCLRVALGSGDVQGSTSPGAHGSAGAPRGEPVTLYMAPSESGLRLLASHAAPDVTIAGNVPLFARLLFGDNAPNPSTASALEISGDIELGQRFQRILRVIEPDWEEHASRLVGDVAAHQLGRAARALRAWGRHAVQTLGQDVTEYLQEESQTLAKRARVNAFMRDVDTLRADFDRLQKRLERMEGGTR